MNEWISKKDLLAETGISYGQLYRWKREGLLPDSWFVKRSAFTGQETFLPRERTLERIRFILENKDTYTLQQLLEQLSPLPDSRSYVSDTLMQLPNAIRPIIHMANLIGSERFNHGQAIMILIGAQILSQVMLPDEPLRLLLQSLIKWQDEYNIMENFDGRVVLLASGETYIPLYLHPDSEVSVPEGIQVIFELPLSDLPEQYTKQLNQLFEGVEHNG